MITNIEYIIKKTVDDIIQKYPSDINSLSDADYETLYDEICNTIRPLTDSLSKDDYKNLFWDLVNYVADESIKAEKSKTNTSVFVWAIDSVISYMRK